MGQKYMNFKKINTRSADGKGYKLKFPENTLFDSNDDGMIYRRNDKYNRNDVLCLNTSEFALQHLLPYNNHLGDFNTRASYYNEILEVFDDTLKLLRTNQKLYGEVFIQHANSELVREYRKFTSKEDEDSWNWDRHKLHNADEQSLGILLDEVNECYSHLLYIERESAKSQGGKLDE